MRAFVPGIYPRSEALVQATRDRDRGRTTIEAVDGQVAADLDAFVAAQRDAGLDLLADGMLRWQDVFRPLVEAAAGLEPGPLTRFLDTNTFYRAPRVVGEPRLPQPLDDRYVSPLDGPRLVTLPSPYAFALGSGTDPRTLAERVLKPQLDALPRDVELVVLSEPFLGREPNPELDELSEALAALDDDRIVLQLPFCDAAPLFERRLAELPVGGVGIDFYATIADAVPEGFDKLLLAGVVDARSSLLEDPRDIGAFAAQLERRSERVALVPNGDLQFVSDPVAREKVRRLGRARTAAVEEAA
jgi:5-methyltetrahydropteroyltriglutamate--homocysteine methyltransferase